MLLLLSWCQITSRASGLAEFIQHVVMVILLPVFTLLAQVTHVRNFKNR